VIQVGYAYIVGVKQITWNVNVVVKMSEIEKDQKEFDEVAASCYIFLTKNGLKKEGARQLLNYSLNNIIDQLDSTEY
jgi:hypothetical protein